MKFWALNYVYVLQKYTKRFTLNEMFQWNASKYAIFYVCIRKPWRFFFTYHFMQLMNIFYPINALVSLKNEKNYMVFIYLQYIFWWVTLEHFVEHKPLIVLKSEKPTLLRILVWSLGVLLLNHNLLLLTFFCGGFSGSLVTVLPLLFEHLCTHQLCWICHMGNVHLYYHILPP